MANTKTNNNSSKACLVWEPARFKKELEQQIAVGKVLLKEELPSSADFNVYANRVIRAYDKSQMNEFEKKMTKWKSYVKEILKAAFDNVISSYYREFASQEPELPLTTPEDILADHKDEIYDEIGVLESIIERLDLIPCSASNEKKALVKTKKVFISHSHKDEEFALAIVDLLHDIGFDYDEIFCSSAPACSIPEGKTIFDVIRAQFEEHELFVIFIHSPRFYASHISMNEMGAAWVLRTDYSSFLTKDMTTDLMKKAVVRDDRVYIQIGDKNAIYRLTEWHERILKFFHKPPVKTNAWMQDSAKFLEKVSKLSYPGSSEDESKPTQDSLSDEDKRRLRSWVNSNDETMYFCDYTGGGGFVVLGNVEYPINSARDKTVWYDYFKRLLSLGLVDYMGLNGNNPVYQLTAKAYKYFD